MEQQKKYKNTGKRPLMVFTGQPEKPITKAQKVKVDIEESERQEVQPYSINMGQYTIDQLGQRSMCPRSSHVYKQSVTVSSLLETTNNILSIPNQKYIFVVTAPEGTHPKLRFGKDKSGSPLHSHEALSCIEENYQPKKPSMIDGTFKYRSGAKVWTAGTLSHCLDGTYELSNDSGHFCPPIESLFRSIAALIHYESDFFKKIAATLTIHMLNEHGKTYRRVPYPNFYTAQRNTIEKNIQFFQAKAQELHPDHAESEQTLRHRPGPSNSYITPPGSPQR